MSASNPYETPTGSPSAVSRRTVTLKRLDVMSVGLMLGVFYAALGLFLGGIFSLLGLLGMAAGGGDAFAGLIFGMGAVIIMPILYGVLGFIGGAITALLYNGCASLVGGIKFDLE